MVFKFTFCFVLDLLLLLGITSTVFIVLEVKKIIEMFIYKTKKQKIHKYKTGKDFKLDL
jgi:hypothetical protein